MTKIDKAVVDDIKSMVDPIKVAEAHEYLEKRDLSACDFLRTSHIAQSRIYNNTPPFFVPVTPLYDYLWNAPAVDFNLHADDSSLIKPEVCCVASKNCPSPSMQSKDRENYRKGWEYIWVVVESTVLGKDAWDIKDAKIASNFSKYDNILLFKIPSKRRVLLPRIVAITLTHNAIFKMPRWGSLSEVSEAARAPDDFKFRHGRFRYEPEWDGRMPTDTSVTERVDRPRFYCVPV